jgi:glutathione S-transferase
MPARLVTIPISHFCEKARWGLQRAGVSYVEQPHLQLVHVAAARRAGGGRSVPVFVTGDGEVIADSTDILHWADRRVAPEHRLYPAGELGAQAAALEDELDEGLGPDGRLWMYHETLPVVSRLRPWA